MRSIIAFGFVVLILTGCSKYQFVMMESDIPKSKKGQIVVNHEDYTIRYSFSGVDGPVRIQILNKTATPLFVRWQPCSRLKNTWPSNHRESLTADASSDAMRIPQYLKVQFPDEKIVIAPFSDGYSESRQLRKAFFHISTPDMKTTEVNGDRVRKQYFGRQNTPLFFISTLEIARDEHFLNAKIETHEFWVNEVTISMIAPEYAHDWQGRDDAFHLRKGSGIGFFLFSMALISYFAASQAHE